MLARSIGLVLAALSAANAWPIFFYENEKCNNYPVFTLYGPPESNCCHNLEHVDIRSYFGGTEDSVQKLLLYHCGEVCGLDAAHRAYSNHTIINSTDHCVTTHVPRAYVFIEEVLGPIKKKTAAIDESSSCGDRMRVQN